MAVGVVGFSELLASKTRACTQTSKVKASKSSPCLRPAPYFVQDLQMTTKKQAVKRASKMKSRAIGLRDQLWPDLDEAVLWDRKTAKGFCTVPRTMPHMLEIIDDLAGKGTPVSRVYLSLWCRVFDEGMIELKSYEDMAYEAGFSGQRAVTAWKQRMAKLANLELILAQPGPRGDYDYILLPNPYIIIKQHHNANLVQKTKYIALYGRAQEVGATDLE